MTFACFSETILSVSHSRRLFIKNLPAGLEEEEMGNAIYEVLSAFGTVLSLTCLCEGSGFRPKGIWFAEMGSRAEMKSAIEALDGMRVVGRRIQVAPTEPLLCKAVKRSVPAPAEDGKPQPRRQPTQLLLLSP